ncbi:hypothetical protein K2173_005948 [Erythroxylum novogranatense]|uniref:DUF1639 family protein n=1 Tax=Erythroxylum novogranatense TaxID=1862640 RepID=A0AAV8TS63_9ROSI|nr:hypothetical protein K2173_005948 [Erythroxylum novogranatense]
MVFSGDNVKEGVVVDNMAMGPEKSKPPLHNFNLHLKWGNQKYLRCKLPSAGGGVPADRHRITRSPPDKLVAAARSSDVRRFKLLKQPRVDGGEEGIEELGEKIMFDLKTSVERMKDAFFRKEAAEDGDGHNDMDVEEEIPARSLKKVATSSSTAAAAAATVVVAKDAEVRPWNLRTRRAPFKMPIGENSVAGNGSKVEEKRVGISSPFYSDVAKFPMIRGEKRERGAGDEKEKERPKFSVTLSKKEIEEDFMKMLGHRPPRRPKKRPRNVQKVMDTIFPGLWLTEVTGDMYKVPEFTDNAKR